MELSQMFGDRAAIERSLSLVMNSDADANARRTALRSLLNQQNAAASGMLESLLNEADLRLDAIRGYAIVENKSAPHILLTRYDKFNPEHRRAVVETLASRRTYAGELLDALRHNSVAKADLSRRTLLRGLVELLGDPFVEFYGQVKSVAEDRERLLAKYKRLATPDAVAAADEFRGRAVFKKTCATCHTLYGDGGKVGPDLTGSNRANLDYILLNSVDPSYDVPDAYKTVTIATVEGRVINGVLAEEDDARVVLKTAEVPRVVIAKEDIEIRKTSPKSMMPDGQLDAMKKQDVLDLIKYLRTTEQVELPQ